MIPSWRKDVMVEQGVRKGPFHEKGMKKKSFARR